MISPPKIKPNLKKEEIHSLGFVIFGVFEKMENSSYKCLLCLKLHGNTEDIKYHLTVFHSMPIQAHLIEKGSHKQTPKFLEIPFHKCILCKKVIH